jgi:hypothetical protein
MKIPNDLIQIMAGHRFPSSTEKHIVKNNEIFLNELQAGLFVM